MIRPAMLLTTVLAAMTAVAQDYPVNYYGENITNDSRYTSAIYLNSADGNQTLATGQTVKGPLYWLIDSNCLSAKKGEKAAPSFEYAGTWMNGYVYIDYNNDGAFDFSINEDGTPAEGSELVSYSNYQGKNSTGAAVQGNNINMPEFTIPADLPSGVYRIRYKVDWSNIDPAGSMAENNTILRNGGIIADAMIAIHGDEQAALEIATEEYGQLLARDGSALPSTITQGQPLALKLLPDEGYVFDHLIVRHRFDKEPTHGNANDWTVKLTRDELRSMGNTLPANCTVGDKVTVEAYFTEKGEDELGYDKYADKGYELVWSDEFNTEDGSHPAFGIKWINSPRRTSTWNKRNSSREDLYVINDGILTLYAKPNDDTAADAAPMITAAMETTGKFAFTHGIVEARIKLNPHKGNFPAFWMMPENSGFNGGWPYCGEIDIMEQINNEGRTYHTLHGYWTNDKSMSVSKTYATTVTDFHDYTLEWTADGMTWYVDGKKAFSFDKSKYASDKYEYPFDRPFHIILNQAVGDGSWAAEYDPEHTYSMQVDYVRVYQKDESDGIDSAVAPTDDVEVMPSVGSVTIHADHAACIPVYDLTGALVKNIDVDGTATAALAPGMYVINSQKCFVR